jgi:hypothetical protein
MSLPYSASDVSELAIPGDRIFGIQFGQNIQVKAARAKSPFGGYMVLHPLHMLTGVSLRAGSFCISSHLPHRVHCNRKQR